MPDIPPPLEIRPIIEPPKPLPKVAPIQIPKKVEIDPKLNMPGHISLSELAVPNIIGSTMSQASMSEQLPGGPLQLMVGDQSFAVSQRAVLFNRPELTTAGLLKKDATDFISQNVINGATAVNSLLNAQAVEGKLSHAINAFWFNLQQTDNVFLKIPIETEGFNVSNALAVLKFKSGEGSKFVAALQDENRPTMQKLIVQILKLQTDQRINSSDIYADHLVIIPESASQLAQNSLKGVVDINTLRTQTRDAMVIHEIPEPQLEKPEQVYQAISKSESPTPITSKQDTKSRILEIVKTEDEAFLEQIANNVAKRGIFGKFDKPVITRGLHSPGKPSLDKDYMMYDADGELGGSALTKSGKYDAKLQFFNTHCYYQAFYTPNSYGWKIPDGVNFNDSLIYSYNADSSPDSVFVGIFMPVSDSDFSNRPTKYTDAYFQLPKEDFTRLLSIIENNSINAERFIQIAFEGIDEFTKRKPVNSVSIVDVPSYLPPNHDYGYNKETNLDLKLKKKDYNGNAVKTFHYPQPLPQFQKT